MTVPLLHNMSARPRTQVRAQLRPLAPAVCRFSLLDASETVDEVLGELAWHDRLEQAWAGYALRGACHVYPWRQDVIGEAVGGMPRLVCARRASLVLNVLARTRSQLLLASAPLALERAFLERELASDDPRLIALAREQT